MYSYCIIESFERSLKQYELFSLECQSWFWVRADICGLIHHDHLYRSDYLKSVRLIVISKKSSLDIKSLYCIHSSLSLIFHLNFADLNRIPT